MLKGLLGVLAVAVIAMLGSPSVKGGIESVVVSFTHILYPTIRAMRSTVALLPTRGFYRLPDSTSVPVTGKDVTHDRDRLERTFVNPQAPDEASVARGEAKFKKTCVPCHGAALKGDGLVAAKFMPPPDLLNSSSRGRTDGFIYSYIRNGGAIMPSYGAQVTAQEAYDLINYLRHLQKTEPR